MRKLSKGILILLMIGVFSVFAAGCGQKEEGAPTSGNESQEELPKYTVAMEASFAPFEFRDEKTGEFIGFDIDLVKAIGEVEGFEPVFKDMGFDGIIASVKTGSVDLAASGLSIDEDRKKQVDFATPYYKSGLAIAVNASNNTIEGVDDLKGKKIAVQIGTTGAKFAATIPGAKLTNFDHVTEALMEMKNGGVDAVINDYPVNQYYINKSGDDFKIVGEILQSEYYGLAVKKGNTEVLNKLNDGLKKLKESGEYAQIYKKWFGVEPPEYLPGEEPAQ